MHLLCTIRQSSDQARYEFLVRDLSRATITLSNERPVLTSDRSRITRSLAAFREALVPQPWSQAGPAAALEALERLGEEIASYLLPQPVSRLLCDPAVQDSILTLETNELQIPWEVARLEGRWLWERFRVGRQQIFEARRDGAPAPPSWLAADDAATRTRIRVLIVADPEDNLPTARREAQALADLCHSKPGWEAEMLCGAQATCGELVERLQSRPFDVVHLACTALYDPRDPTQSRLFLADEPLPARRLGDVRFAGRPRLVFMNACQAAREDVEGPMLSRTSGWGRLFLSLGAEAMVGPLWDVRDLSAVGLSETFYRALVDGAGVGDALQRGRMSCGTEGDPYLTRHAYVIYGSPLLHLAPAPAHEAATTGWVLKPRFHLRIMDGPQAGRIIPLLPKTMLEGRRIQVGSAGDRANDLDLGDETLSNEEAAIVYSRGAYHLVNESGRPETTVDGVMVPAGERIRLAGGERIHLGQSVLAFVAGAPGDVDDARWTIEVMGGPDRGQRFLLKPGTTEIGRGADCQVRLTDTSVSRLHASLVQEGDGVQIVPRTTNPTLVNGIPLAGARLLRGGDEIQLSEETLLRFVTLP